MPAAVQASAAALAKVLKAEGLDELPGALIRDHCGPVAAPPSTLVALDTRPQPPQRSPNLSRALPQPAPSRYSSPSPDSSPYPPRNPQQGAAVQLVTAQPVTSGNLKVEMLTPTLTLTLTPTPTLTLTLTLARCAATGCRILRG